MKNVYILSFSHLINSFILIYNFQLNTYNRGNISPDIHTALRKADIAGTPQIAILIKAVYTHLKDTNQRPDLSQVWFVSTSSILKGSLYNFNKAE